MSSPIADTIKEFIAGYFSVSAASINNATVADDIAGWDSMANAEIILGLEDKLEIELDVEDLLEMDDVGCMIAIFEKRQAG